MFVCVKRLKCFFFLYVKRLKCLFVCSSRLAASIAAEEDGRKMNHASTYAADAKGKRKITDIASEGKEPVSGSYNQEAIDEM